GALEGKGLELLYLDDPVELFFMQIQGSGRVRLTDGSWMRLGYAAKNGHSYVSIGKILAERGDRPKDLTMEGLKAWLRADPARGRALMQENTSYVFFRQLPKTEAGDGPVGAQGVALTPGRSLAVDASFHALGTPIFVAAPALKTPDGIPFRRLMIAQDVGSASRGHDFSCCCRRVNSPCVMLITWASADMIRKPTPSCGRASRRALGHSASGNRRLPWNPPSDRLSGRSKRKHRQPRRSQSFHLGPLQSHAARRSIVRQRASSSGDGFRSRLGSTCTGCASPTPMLCSAAS